MAAFACDFPEFDVRRRSVHRKHGDPFPLPRLGKPNMSSKLARRVDSACGALNQLASAVFNKANKEEVGLTHVQSWMLSDLFRRVANYGDEPLGLSDEQCLRDLGCNANLYTQEANHIAPYNINEIKILQRELSPLLARDLAPPETQTYLDNFADLVERDSIELEALRAKGDLVEPHWDERLKRDRLERMRLYQRLHKCGLLTYRRRQKARVGIFCVKKKGDKPGNSQRLIVDCRQSNHLQRRPPRTRLATPAGLGCLDFTREELQGSGFEADECGNFHPSAETGDVGDCFYNFTVPAACSWFSTGDSITRREMQAWNIEETTIYDDELGHETDLALDEAVFIVFKGVPMGWSWALYIAQEVVSWQVLQALGMDDSKLIKDKQPPPTIQPSQPAVGVYVDNVHTFGGQTSDAGEAMKQIAGRFQELNIPFEVDNIEGAATMDTLGLTFDFSQGVVVRAKKERAWRLWHATRALLRRRRISGDTLRVWLGHVNFHFLLCRPALSSISSCYRFAIDHLGHRFPMWPSVRKEMKQVLGLIFVVEKNLSSPVNPEVHVGDSSDKGYGMLHTFATVEQVKRELRFKERWRYLESEEVEMQSVQQGSPMGLDDLEDNHVFKGACGNAGFGPVTAYGAQLKQQLEESEGSQNHREHKVKLFGKPQQSVRTMISIPGIPEVSNLWSEQNRWELITADRWRRQEEHINVKEGRVALMSLRRLCRSTKNMGSTCLTLSDNMVTILAFEKGRSCSGPMNTLCRRVAAYSIGSNIQWRLRHIRSEKNVADEPSRRWGEDTPRKLGSRDFGIAVDGHIPIDSFEHGVSLSSSSSSLPSHSPIRSSTSHRTSFLEIFSGSGNLSKSIHKAGMRAYPGFEVAIGE